QLGSRPCSARVEGIQSTIRATRRGSAELPSIASSRFFAGFFLSTDFPNARHVGLWVGSSPAVWETPHWPPVQISRRSPRKLSIFFTQRLVAGKHFSQIPATPWFPLQPRPKVGIVRISLPGYWMAA